MIQKKTFLSNGQKILADLYLPDAGCFPCPAVVMAPGFGGVKEMLIPFYARALVDAGIATLAIDFPHFGESEGEPRQHIDINAQLAAYRRALDELRLDERIDGYRLGVWGSSLSGGHALVVASSYPQLKSAMAIIPFIAVSFDMTPGFVRAVTQDLIKRTWGGAGDTLKIAGLPTEFAAMNSDGAWEWMQAMTQDVERFRNEVTVGSLLEMARYRTKKAAQKIRIPLKVILATDDSITPARRVKRALAGVPGVSFDEYPETHFELFDTHLEDTVRTTVEWFRATL